MKRSLISALALALCLVFASAASAEENGLNADLAKAIVQYREEMGDFMSIDELSDVPGMDKEALDAAKQALRVDAISGAECNC